MLGHIEKIRETTIAGRGSEARWLKIDQDFAKPLRDLGIVCACMASLKAPYLLLRGDNEPRHHDWLFVLQGVIDLQTSEGNFVLHRGDVVIIPSWVDRKLELRKGSPLFQQIYFYVWGDALSPMLKTSRVSIHRAHDMQGIKSAMQGFILESTSPRIASQRAALSYAELIAVHLLRECDHLSNPRKSEQQQRFVSLWQNIDNHIDQNWTVSSLAKLFGTSSSHFFRLTEEHYGHSPMQHLTLLRIERAKDMLSRTSMTLSDIAEKLGYSSAYSLSEVFRRHTKMRPGKYRSSRSVNLT